MFLGSLGMGVEGGGGLLCLRSRDPQLWPSAPTPEEILFVLRLLCLFRSNRYIDFANSVKSFKGPMFVLKTADVSRNARLLNFSLGCQNSSVINSVDCS